MSIISERRKSKAETQPTVSKIWQRRQRPIEAALLHGRSLRVKATELPRRRFLHLAAGAAAGPATSRIAMAQAYPARPVRIIVGLAAGGSQDVTTRLIAQWLSERLGQQFIVENRVGASGNLATEAVAKAAPDGYTLLAVATTHAINATLFEKLNFSFIRDIAPVAGIMRVPNVLEVHPSVPAATVPEYIGYAKANPGKINYATGGSGTSNHVSGELFKMMAGVDLVHVPYRCAGPALTDLIGGHVQVMFDSLPSSIEYIRVSKLRALAVTTATRSLALPAVPVVADFVPGYEASAFFGIGGPKNMPTEIIDKLNREINAALGDPRMQARFADLGGMLLSGSPARKHSLLLPSRK